MVLFASFSFAQGNYRLMPKKNTTTMQEMNMQKALAKENSGALQVLQTSVPVKPLKLNRNSQYRVTGNPVWDETMSYCMDADFASSIGLGSPGDVYWGIKIESAALTGRNNITDVQLFVAYAGSYTLNIYSGVEPTGTPIATQTITATEADTMAWKTIHFTNPIAITQSQDLWVTFHCSTLSYPATGVTGNEYDNGKYISLDGTSWDLISTYGLDYTWMIKVVSDTYTPAPPSVILNGPAYVLNGDTATYTVSSPNASTFAWNITADYTTSNGNTAQAMWLTDGTHQVIASATNSVATTYDTMDVEVYSCNAITTFPYFNGFESGDALCWTMVSMDPANDALFGVQNDAGYAYEGDYDFWFSSYYSASDYNQYLITPELQLPATGIYMVKFYYQGYSSNDVFKVLVSTTTNELSSFTMLADFTTIPTTEWGEAALVLPAGTKYVAINYYGNYAYLLYVDNFSIQALEAPEVTLAGPTEAPVNTAVTFTATSPLADSFAWTVDGTAVSETSNVLTQTFTTLGNHTVEVTATNTAGSTTASITHEAYTCSVIDNFPYSNGFETGTARCWSMVSMDPANDDRFGVYEDQAAFAGNYDFRFSSFHSASDYNQYLITPELQLPATGTYMVKFQYKGYTSSDEFSVMASTTTDDITSFTELQAYETVATSWTETAVLLPAGTKYVAIHYYGDFAYYLYVDEFSIETLGAPTVTVSGPTSVGAGSPATFVATAPLATSFAWTVDGTAVSSTTNTMSYTFTTGGNHTVAVTASNSEGSNTASMTVNVFTCDPITTFPFTEDFENEATLGCWTFVDADGDGYNWDPSFLRDVEDEDTGLGYGNNGSYGIIASASYINYVGALTPDNWMITPEIVIPANGTYKLSWYAKGQDAGYSDEYYSVYVSTMGANIGNFTTALYNGVPTGAWAQYSASLADFAGQTIRIAFRHHDVTDMFWLDIDDISITEGVGIDNHDMNISVYPNPAANSINVMGEGIEQVEILDINGRTLLSFNEGGQLNIGSLANGMYLIRIVTENGVQMNKIVKR